MARDTRGLRLGVLGVVSLLLMGALGVRLWFLQVVDAEAVSAKFNAVRTRSVILPPERGRIFDATGRIVADNERILTVTVDQEVIRNRPRTREDLFRRLAGPLGYTSWLELELRFCGPTPDIDDTFIDESNPNLPDKNCNGVFDPYLPFPAKEDVTEQMVRFLRERSQDYPGVDVIDGWRREYPYAPLASQIVGYLGSIPEDNKDTLERNEYREYIDAGYRVNDKVGRAGIEQWFEKELRGSPGRAEFEIDASGNVLREVSRTEPMPGQDLQLTIDLYIQQYAEQALETQVKNRRSAPNPYCKKKFDGSIDLKCYSSEHNYKAPAGSLVVEHHASGQIIAMASYPTFDNRWFGAGISGAKFKELFPADVDKNPDTNPSPLINRAIQGRYQVGSTFKPFTAFAAMNTGFIADPVNYHYLDEGSYTIAEEFCNPDEVAKCTFRNAWNYTLDQPNVYGDLTLDKSLAVSSDAFYYRIGVELFLLYRDIAPVLQNQYKLFGFGEKSGIELPYEYKGIVPDKEVKKRLAEQEAITEKEGRGFYVGDALQMALGQGLNAVTPLQLTNAYSALANGGHVMKPQIVKAIFEPGVPDGDVAGFADIEAGVIAVPYGPVERAFIGQNPDYLLLIKSGLQQALQCQPINGRTPTGCDAFRGFDFKSVLLAGKTGTAQGRDSLPEYDSSAFVAFDSDNELEGYTVGAYIEKGGFGGAGSAPLVRCMFQAVYGQLTPEQIEDVELSDPLNIAQPTAAPIRFLPQANTCLDVKVSNQSRER
jgi:penicillin-binding protein 2